MCTCDKHPVDRLNEVTHKLALITELTCRASDQNAADLSGKSLVGLYWFLRETEDAIDAMLAHHKED